MANEKRLIDASVLIRDLTAMKSVYDAITLDGIIKALKEAPTVDAVEVCCKGCKHWLHVEEGFGDCTNPRFHLPGHADPTMNADDYCSCGERRNEG